MVKNWEDTLPIYSYNPGALARWLRRGIITSITLDAPWDACLPRLSVLPNLGNIAHAMLCHGTPGMKTAVSAPMHLDNGGAHPVRIWRTKWHRGYSR